MKEKKVIFIDSEGVSLERLQQICGDGYRKIMEKMLLFSPYSLQQQEEMVKKSSAIDAGLVILDTANSYYRLEFQDDEKKATRSLIRQLVSLQVMARKKEIPVLITSQVYSMEESVEPFAGKSMEHMVKAIIKLEKIGIGKREATIIKHRSQPEGKTMKFSITSRGLE
jgi:DNA repair protein RadB